MPRDLAQLADEDLVARVARGDDSALAALYDRFGSIAYGLALRVVRDRTLAEDAVQEAFLAVWRGARGFERSRGSARTWILTLVHRRAVDRVRREERQARPIAEPEVAGSTSGADEAAVAREERSLVQAALAELLDDQRTLLELAYYGGLTQSELADRLGEPLGTIKSRTFTGLRRLRTILEERA